MSHEANTINIALIGCGRISHKHLSAIDSLNAKFYAVCDTDKSKMEKLNVDNKFANYKDLLKDSDIDVVDICAPSGLHYKIALDAIMSDKDVIVEKPVSMTVAETEKLIKIAKKRGRILLPVMQNRFNPAIMFLKNKMPELGKINFIEAACFWYRPQEYYSDGWHGTKKMDGGVLMNQGIHYVDMISNILGSNPKEVSAFGGTYGHKMECEDVISVNIKFEDGVIASLRANTISYPENFEGSITVFFEKATVKIGGKAMNQIISWIGVGEEASREFSNVHSDDIYGGGHKEVIKNMYDIKLNNAKLYMRAEEALQSIKIIEAAYKSIQKNRNIKI